MNSTKGPLNALFTVGLASSLMMAAGCLEPGNPDPLYAVGGTVTGISGEIALVVNNGQNTEGIYLTADGPFNFVTQFSSGEAYDVTVAEQPAEPLFCSVINGNGAILLGDIADIVVECATCPSEARDFAASFVSEFNSNWHEGLVAGDVTVASCEMWGEWPFAWIYDTEHPDYFDQAYGYRISLERDIAGVGVTRWQAWANSRIDEMANGEIGMCTGYYCEHEYGIYTNGLVYLWGEITWPQYRACVAEGLFKIDFCGYEDPWL